MLGALWVSVSFDPHTQPHEAGAVLICILCQRKLKVGALKAATLKNQGGCGVHYQPVLLELQWLQD